MKITQITLELPEILPEDLETVKKGHLIHVHLEGYPFSLSARVLDVKEAEYQGKAAYDPDPLAMRKYPTQSDKNYDRFDD